MTTTREILVKARALVERGWVQGRFSRMKRGKECFCAVGAICRAAGEAQACHRLGALKAVEDEIPQELLLSQWNDAPGRTQAEVLAAFDKAIQAEGGE